MNLNVLQPAASLPTLVGLCVLTAISGISPIARREHLPFSSHLPILFQPLRDKSPKGEEFYSQIGMGAVRVSPTGYTCSLSAAPPRSPSVSGPLSQELPVHMDVEFVDSNPSAQPSIEEPSETRLNYFIGRSPKDWRTNVPGFHKVRYRGVYPNIDVVYYGNQDRLEYDFVLAPFADSSRIQLKVPEADRVELLQNGDLRITKRGRSIFQRAPIAYQMKDGKQVVVNCHFRQDGALWGFEIENRDPSLELIIDPVIEFSTYLGGSTPPDEDDRDAGLGVAVGPDGSVFVSGTTSSLDFPTISPIQSTRRGTYDAFVAKFDSSGTRLLYCTYIGGSDVDRGRRVTIGSDGSAYLVGYSNSTDFPIANAYQSSNRGSWDGFVTKISPNGSQLTYSTYVGSSGIDEASDIALDSAGAAHICGYTFGTDFPVVNAFQPQNAGSPGGIDAFITRLSPSGTSISFSTYLGGSGIDAALGVCVGQNGEVYATGYTTSSNFPRQNALQQSFGGGDWDAFAVKLNSNGNQLQYGTYLGGSGYDWATAVAVDASGQAIVTGQTYSPNFPLANAYQSVRGGPSDAFVSKLNFSGNGFIHSTLLGANGSEVGTDVELGSDGSIYVTGITGSTTFPVVSPVQPNRAGASFDAFVSRFASNGSSLSFSSYLGGTGDEGDNDLLELKGAICVTQSGDVLVTGVTRSNGFPTANAVQSTKKGFRDTFLTKISFSLTSPASPTNLTGVFSAPLSVGLSWQDNSNNEAAFSIERRSGVSSFTKIASTPANQTSYTDNTISAGTLYVYRVIATNAAGSSVYSNEVNVQIPGTGLSAPSNLTIGSATSTSLRLDWTDNSNNEQAFEIERRSGSSGFQWIADVPANQDFFVNSALQPTTTYWYRVRAINAEGESGYSAEASGTTLATPIPAPSGLTAQVVTGSHVRLSWTDNSTNESGFTIQRHGVGQSFSELTTVAVNGTQYDDTSVASNTQYWYRVRAFNANAVSEFSNEASATPAGGSGTGLSATYYDNIDFSGTAVERLDAKVDFPWDNGAPAEGIGVDTFAVRWLGLVEVPTSGTYTFYSETDDGVRLWVNDQLLVDRWVDQPSTRWSGTIVLQAGQRYHLRMDYYERGGGAVARLLWSGPGIPTAVIPKDRLYPDLSWLPGQPANLTAQVMGPSEIRLAWAAGGNSTSYLIERKVDNGLFETRSTVTSATEFTDGNIALNSTYHYRVWAMSPGSGISKPSPTATARINSGGRLVVTPARLNFPQTRIGVTRRKPITLKNTGTGDLLVSVASPKGAFRVVGNSNAVIGQRKSVRLTVEFAPPARGSVSSELTVRSTDSSRSDVRVGVKGTGR